MIEVSAATIREAYLRMVQMVFSRGDEVEDERGQKTLELSNLSSHITRPQGGYFRRDPMSDTPRGCVWNKKRLQVYSEEFLNDDNQGFVYTYGERLRGGTDQIQAVIDRLKSNPESRRAVATTWIPEKDCASKDVPCLMFITFQIRDNFLNTTAAWRSHDIYGAYYPNLIGIYTIAEHVLKHLKGWVHMGYIHTHSVSAHIYEHDIDSVKRLLQQNKGDY